MTTEQIQEIPQSIQPVQQVPVEPKKKLSLSTIVILLVAIVLICVGGIYAVKRLSQPKACTQEAKVCPDGSSVGRIDPNCEFAPCPTQVPSPPPTSDETANWKTYTNTKYGFKFKYPQKWEINRGPGGESDEMLSKSSEVSFFQGNSGFVLQIDEFEGKCLTLKDCISKISLINSNYKDSTKEAKTLLNYPAEVITYNRIDTQLNQGNIELFSFTNDKFYHFHFYDINSDFEKTKIVFDQILSTFKFLDQPSLAPKPTAGWKTSIFPKLGVQLNLPPLWFIHEEIVVGGLGTVTTNISYPVNNPSPQVYMENQKVSVNISVGTKTKGLEERAKEYTQVDFEPLKITGQKTIGGEEALVLELENSEQPFQVYLVDNKKLSYYISISIPIEYNQEAKPLFSVFDQILSTFKFLD